ncbi:MAG: hypothetical protein KatS3mg110_0409 [Pirellulaceae bacterium]|nr:MAG: hypothetical protein KatS3mg110_0409 [Pirellulaceae bacterium]
MEGQLQGILEALTFSAHLPEDVVRQFAVRGELEQCPAGTVLFREGSPAFALYLVVSGRVALEMRVPGRGDVRILTLGPGDMIGWSSLVGQRKMTATAVAIEDTQSIKLPAVTLQELCDQDHHFGYHLMRRMAEALAQRLLATRLQLLDLFSDTVTHEPGTARDGDGR